MTIRRLVVFSGFDTKFIERARGQLQSIQAKVIFTSAANGLDSKYFESLLGSTLTFMDETLKSEDGTRIVGLIASSIQDEVALELEKRAFFPAFRRFAFPYNFSRDINRVNEVTSRLMGTIKSDEFLGTYEYVKPSSAVLSLPLMNTNSRRLAAEMRELYELRSFRPTAGLDKEVVRMRRGRGMRVRGIDFAGCVNDASHPIRRCSESVLCDVSSRLRLGFSVPARFEFDVTSEQGVAGKEFQLCDGTVQKIPGWADYLNMRINDDFRPGKRT